MSTESASNQSSPQAGGAAPAGAPGRERSAVKGSGRKHEFLSKVFAHPQDVHCFIYHMVSIGAYLAAFWVWLNPEQSGVDTTLDRIAFTLGAGLLLGWISGIDVGVNFHNHTHRRIFRSSFLNRWFGRFWTFSGGWPSYYWDHSHIVVHHANVLEDNDWTVPKRSADGRYENIYKYLFLHWPWRYAIHFWKDFTTGVGGHRVGRRAIKELAIFLAMWSIPFLIDPLMGLALWLFPQWIGNVMIMGSGMYVQHSGCVSKSVAPMRHSNTFLSPFFNMTMFNIGYHVEHHDFPAVHWSVLPRLHKELMPKMLAANSHVVPYGYYHAAHIVSGSVDGDLLFERDEAEGFERNLEASPSASAASESKSAVAPGTDSAVGPVEFRGSNGSAGAQPGGHAAGNGSAVRNGSTEPDRNGVSVDAPLESPVDSIAAARLNPGRELS